MNDTANSQTNIITTSTEEQKDASATNRPVSWYSILGLGAVSTSRFLLPLLVINSVLVIMIFFLSQPQIILNIPVLDPAFIGYVVYFLNWGAFFDFTDPLLNITLTSLVSLVFVSLYTLAFVIIGIHFDPKDPTPWWTQLKTMKLPSVVNMFYSLVTFIIAETIPLIVIIVLISHSSVNSSELINSLIISSIFIIFLGVAVVFIELSIIFLYDEPNTERSTPTIWDQLRKFWYEGIFLFLAFPLALIVLLLGGSLLVFFPVIIFNFLTNGSMQIASGAIMTQVLGILVLSVLFFYPAYPALTWGQFYRYKLNTRIIAQSTNTNI